MPSRLPDRIEGTNRAIGGSLDHLPSSSSLNDQQAHTVGYDVVELTGNPSALLRLSHRQHQLLLCGHPSGALGHCIGFDPALPYQRADGPEGKEQCEGRDESGDGWQYTAEGDDHNHSKNRQLDNADNATPLVRADRVCRDGGTHALDRWRLPGDRGADEHDSHHEQRPPPPPDKRDGHQEHQRSQRLGLAVALLGDPPTLVLDEPSNGLDPEGIHWLRQFLRRLAAEGRTVFVSSHLMAEMAVTADHLIVINKRCLLADTATDEFIKRNARTFVRIRTPDSERFRQLLSAAGMAAEIADNGSIEVTGATPADVSRLAGANHHVLDELSTQSASLEEAFLRLTSTTNDLAR